MTRSRFGIIFASIALFFALLYFFYTPDKTTGTILLMAFIILFVVNLKKYRE